MDKCLNDSCPEVGVDSEVFKTDFKDCKVFTGLWLRVAGCVGGWVAEWLV